MVTPSPDAKATTYTAISASENNDYRWFRIRSNAIVGLCIDCVTHVLLIFQWKVISIDWITFYSYYVMHVEMQVLFFIQSEK